MSDTRPLARTLATSACIVLMIWVAACTTRTVAPVEDRRALPPRAQPGEPPVDSVPPPSVSAAPRTGAEPDWRPQSYTVKRGDTLHAIALEHGLDYRELATWNAIENPNLIRVGQVLRLSPPGESTAVAGTETSVGVTTAPLRSAAPVVESRTATAAVPVAPATPSIARNTETLKVSPKAVKERYSAELAREMAKVPVEPAQVARVEPTQVARVDPAQVARVEPAKAPTSQPATTPAASAPPPVTPAPPPVVANVAPSTPSTPSTPTPSTPSTPRASSEDDGDLEWMWPAKGKLVTGFSDTANLKGIDIAGAAGQPVLASAPGRIVYAGSGLRGYGKLVIIKHNNTFLSAYAHNRDILVKEGQQVKRGEKIAEMGSTDADTVKLHFEIRRLGKPMDPLKYLPPG
jgi:lipoprotein NlpD